MRIIIVIVKENFFLYYKGEMEASEPTETKARTHTSSMEVDQITRWTTLEVAVIVNSIN